MPDDAPSTLEIDTALNKLWTAFESHRAAVDEWRKSVDNRMSDFRSIFDRHATDWKELQALKLQVEKLHTWMGFVKIIGGALWALTLVVTAALLQLILGGG